MPHNLDFIAIGDITTDAFIKIPKETAHVTCDSKGRACQICFNFGDKIEYESVTEIPSVGNSPNAAVSAKRLGLTSALVTDLGDDYHGKIKIARLEKEGIDTRFVKIHAGLESNYHYVLWYEAERTILVKHQEYPYELPDIGTPRWIYLSSVGEQSTDYHKAIGEYLKKNESVKFAFQPGTFQIKAGHKALESLYKESDLFFCNREEAQRILGTNESDIKKLLTGVHEFGPTMPVITDGPDGAYTYDGEETWHMPMYPDPAPPIDRTGAGDSFSSTFTAMLALGKSVPEALMRAPINSASVVQKIGAQEGLLTLDELEEWLAKAPADYKPTKI